jgi:hypothetical protein
MQYGEDGLDGDGDNPEILKLRLSFPPYNRANERERGA